MNISDLLLNGGSIQENTASAGAGIADIGNSTLSIGTVEFTSNQATFFAGAIASYASHNLNIWNSSFVGNTQSMNIGIVHRVDYI
jgi:hypothetical protein